ncbi:hypothetical protein ACFLZA_02115 [Candidatus Neomarinimicrobiota bacterium]
MQINILLILRKAHNPTASIFHTKTAGFGTLFVEAKLLKEIPHDERIAV